MWIDVLARFTENQVINAGIATANDHYDAGSDRNLGVGEPLAVVFNTKDRVGAANGIGATVQTADDAAFTQNPAVIATVDNLNANAGPDRRVVYLPKDDSVKRYLRVRFSGGAGNKTITVTVDLMPANFVDAYTTYPKGFVVD